MPPVCGNTFVTGIVCQRLCQAVTDLESLSIKHDLRHLVTEMRVALIGEALRTLVALVVLASKRHHETREEHGQRIATYTNGTRPGPPPAEGNARCARLCGRSEEHT